jgi:SAM-dependent methyltransferase
MRNLDRYERLHGTDIASNRVARARNSSASHVLVNVANLDAGLPYADSVFDVAACLAVLEHVFDPYLLVGELVRVLKPGGQLIVEVPNLAFLAHRVALLLGKLPRTAFNEPGWDGGHLHYFTFGALKELLTSNGIRVSGECCAGIGHRLRSLRPQLLGADIILVGFKA